MILAARPDFPVFSIVPHSLGLAPDQYPLLSFSALLGRASALLYCGRAGDALATLTAARGEIRAAHLLHCQRYRVELAHLRGRAALARLSERRPRERWPLHAVIRRCVRALRGEGAPWADALAESLDASFALATIPRERALPRLHASAQRLDAAGLGGVASAVRWQLANDLGHPADHGAAWRGAAVARPDRLAHTLAPLPAY